MVARLKWCIVLCDNDFGAWRSSVARLLWEQEVPGSNPGAPIKLFTLSVFRWGQYRGQFWLSEGLKGLLEYVFRGIPEELQHLLAKLLRLSI